MSQQQVFCDICNQWHGEHCHRSGIPEVVDIQNAELTTLKADVVRLRNGLNGLRRGSGCFCDYHLQNLHTNACLDAARALEETKP